MGGTSFPSSRGGDSGVTAVGATQYGAPVLGNAIVVVSAVGAEQAVQLPSAKAGEPPLSVVVVGDASAMVFPSEGGSIQGGNIDAPFEVPLLVTATFIPVADNDWVVNLSAAPSAPPLVRTPEMEAEAAAARVKEKAEVEKAKAEAAEKEAKERAEAEKDEEDAEARHKAKNKRHPVTAEA